ncbi:cyclopropane-fatty-acyl-phospholipid synthase family protein [bacterium]|nr:cyclopropane-fatty-acyl-phospholipid synthase family protein [bacterium]
MLQKVLPEISVEYNFNSDGIEDKSGKGYVLHPPTLAKTVHMLMFPDFWVGAYYARGNWFLSKGDLAEFMLELMKEAPPLYMRYFGFVSKLRGPLFRMRRYFLDPLESRKVETHYDLEAELYESFLDDEMLYTCAFFEDGAKTLEQAQDRKKELVAERLEIDDGQIEILDVGSGWGAFERFFTRRYPDMKITGITLAANQISWAEKRNAKELSADQISRIQYERKQYLEFRSSQSELFDRIFAVGMIEHVGLRNYRDFVQNTKRLLKTGGKCLVHTIVSPASALPSNKWIDTFVFPGGYTPSLSELIDAFEVDGLIIEDVYLHEGRNYFMTLEEWRQRFLKNWLEIKRSRDQSQFGRMWHFYLSVARNMFDDELLRHQVAHIVIKKL